MPSLSWADGEKITLKLQRTVPSWFTRASSLFVHTAGVIQIPKLVSGPSYILSFLCSHHSFPREITPYCTFIMFASSEFKTDRQIWWAQILVCMEFKAILLNYVHDHQYTSYYPVLPSERKWWRGRAIELIVHVQSGCDFLCIVTSLVVHIFYMSTSQCFISELFGGFEISFPLQ